MRTWRISVLRAAAISLLAVSPIALADVATGRHLSEGVTSHNVDRIELYSHGHKRGELRLVSPGVWQERTNPASDRPSEERAFEYEEAARDDSAVILRDTRRGIELALDIAAGKVFYSDNNIKRQPVYDIGSVTRAEMVNGRRVRYVSFAAEPGSGSPGASLTNESGDLWVLREGDERSFFYERSRSEGGIQLRHYTNQALVGINFLNLTAGLTSTDGRQSRSFAIDDISDDVPPLPGKPPLRSDRPNGRSAMQMILGAVSGDYGVLARGPSQVWTIRSTGDGRLLGTYYETSRDDWSIYLAVDPAGAQPRLRVDLFEMQVYQVNSGRVAYVVRSPSNTPVPSEQRVARSTHYPPNARPQGTRPAPPAATGFHADLGSVVYGEGGSRVGEYTNLGDGRWQDSNIYGGSLVLAEERRSADAVYLSVPGRNETIQLNLTTRRVNRLTSASTAALYDILSTTARPPSPLAAPEVSVAGDTAAAVPVTNTPAPTTRTPTLPATSPRARGPIMPVEDRQPLPPPVRLDTRTNPRLTRASTSPTECGNEGQRPCSTAPAEFVQAGAAQGCPSGSQLFPLVRGGSCWSCPEGSRYIFPSDIEGPQACTFPASQARAPARYTGLVQMFRCPNGGEARGLDNRCFKCPEGYRPDLLEQADGPRGCFRDKPARFAAATRTRTLACPEGSNAELLDNGNCWECPDGFSRSGSPPSWPDACTTNIWDATFASLGAGTCKSGLENFRGVCERRGACGAIGGRPCEIGERMPSCDSGAREDFKTNSCVALQPGESPFIAGLGSVGEFYGDSVVAFCQQAIGNLRFDGSTDLGIGANCTKDIFTGAGCQYLAAAMGGRYAAMLTSAASVGPQFEQFKRNVDVAYEAAPCNALTETLRPATHHGAASGFACPDEQFWDPNGSCYSCPDGFSRTMNPVTSAGACVDKPANELARSACAVYRAATQDLEDAVLCSREVLESGVFLERPLDLSGAQSQVCMAAGEFAFSVYTLITSMESPEKKSGRIRDALKQFTGIVGAAAKASDKGDALGTAFDQLEHCE